MAAAALSLSIVALVFVTLLSCIVVYLLFRGGKP